MAPRKGFEPSTYRLTAERSTVELSRNIIWRRPTLPQGYPCSTIGALKLNLRVRYGNGCYLQAIITRYENINILSKLHSELIFFLRQKLCFFLAKEVVLTKEDISHYLYLLWSSPRLISISQLNMLPCLHL